jgi:hypothetical protein
LNDLPINDIIVELKNRELSPSYIKNILCALKWNDPSKGDKYSQEIMNLIKEINNLDTNINKFEKLDWDDILKMDISGDTTDDLIKGLFILFPPRRLNDYACMKYVENVTDTTDANYNYYIATSCTFIFQNYKTCNKYGRQVFVIDELLRDVISRYVAHNDITYGQKLIKYRKYAKRQTCSEKSTFCDTSSLRKKLLSIFGTSVNGLRHSYISWLYKTPRNILNIRDISNKMAHGITMHLNYIDKDNF